MKAVVLFSGEFYSTTTLAIAKSEGRNCYPLTAIYGQRHDVEIDAAMNISAAMGEITRTVNIAALGRWLSLALTSDITVPKDRTHAEMSDGVPAT